MPSAGGDRYRVVQSDAFRSAWDAGVAAGWLDPVEHQASLDFYARTMLLRAPHRGEPVPEIAANVLVIRFPRSLRSLTYIELFYSIIEDDRTVILEDVNLLPGPDYEGQEPYAS